MKKNKTIISNESVFEILVHNMNSSNKVRYLSKLEEFEGSGHVSVHLGENEYCKYSAYGLYRDYKTLLAESEWGLADEDIDWEDIEEFERFLKNVKAVRK